MVDQFIWGSVSRISPEAPVPVVRLDRETFCLGGAGNVVRNIAALGGRAIPVGARGDDRDGEAFERLCRESGIATEGLVVAPGRPTTVKTRVVAHNQQVVRVDREAEGPLEAGPARALRERALSCLDRATTLIVSDYDKGAIVPDLLASLLPEAARRRLPIVIDPKIRLFRHYRPATVVTPNAREAMEASGEPARTDEEFERAARGLLALLGCPHLLITRGERGMLLVEAGGPAIGIAATAREVFDVTGAGDTVVATLALALACGATMTEAAVLANRAAGVVVGKIGTASLTAAELLKATSPSPGPSGSG